MEHVTSSPPAPGALRNAHSHALRNHWPEYLIEAWGLGMFMISAGSFGGLGIWIGSQTHTESKKNLCQRIALGLYVHRYP